MQNSTICIKKRKTRYNTQWVPKVKACLIEALPLMSVRPKSNISISNVVAFTAITVSQLKLRCCSEALQLADKTMPDRWKDKTTEKEWERVLREVESRQQPCSSFECTSNWRCCRVAQLEFACHSHTHTHTQLACQTVFRISVYAFSTSYARALSLTRATCSLSLPLSDLIEKREWRKIFCCLHFIKPHPSPAPPWMQSSFF